MNDRSTLEGLKQRGATTPAPAELRVLYQAAFRDCGLRALWSSRAVERPTIAGLLAITESLRVEGRVAGRRLAGRRVRCRRCRSRGIGGALIDEIVFKRLGRDYDPLWRGQAVGHPGYVG